MCTMQKSVFLTLVLVGIATVIAIEIDLTENAEVNNPFDDVTGLVKKKNGACNTPKCQSGRSRQRQLRLLHAEGKPCGRYCQSWKRSALAGDTDLHVDGDDKIRREWYDQALQNCKPYCNWLKRRSRSTTCKWPFCDNSQSPDIDDDDNNSDDNDGRRALIGLPYCLPLCQGRN
ncbi:uncharacterized protein LOC144364070 [Saccoglossus kowalevskii]